jgi:hypothetical protein
MSFSSKDQIIKKEKKKNQKQNQAALKGHTQETGKQNGELAEKHM